MKKIVGFLFLLFFASSAWAGVGISDFEELDLAIDSYWNGSDGLGGFTSGVVNYGNIYNAQWDSWEGFAYSNLIDTVTSGFGSQYNAIAGGGYAGSETYGISFVGFAGSPTLTLTTSQVVTGAYFTNNNYVYYSMLNGDAFAKQFEAGDFFRLTVTGRDENGMATGTVDVDLADGTDIVDYWRAADLTTLGVVKSLEFSLSSSDVGQYGMNTPAYFCLDNLKTSDSLLGTVGFEDQNLVAGSYWNGSDRAGGVGSDGANFYNNYNTQFGSWDGFALSNVADRKTEGFAAQHNAITGRGKESRTYGVGFFGAWAADPPTVSLPSEQTLRGVYVTNNAYPFFSMLKGDAFAKQFEASDWFKLTVTGRNAAGNQTGTVDFFLGNGRDIINTWNWVDLSGLGAVKTLEFSLTSSDVGQYGVNTPTYFCMDNLNAPAPTVGQIGFEDLMLGAESSWNGSSAAGGFTSGNVRFSNSYDGQWDAWDGFSYSNLTDTTAEGFDAQYHAITGKGVASSNYAVGFVGFANPPTVTFPKPQRVTGAYFTNCNYPYYSMLKGDAFSKQFEAGDWLKLTVTGKDANGNQTGAADLMLARDTDILKTWKWLDLSGLGEVKSLEFILASSDVGQFGMNTPGYFCLDNLNGDPGDRDDNANGIPDDQEVASHVDLDGDGTPDADQPTIKSVKASEGNVQMGVSAASSRNITEIVAVKAVSAVDIEEDLDRPTSMPFGLLDFTLRVAQPGDAVSVTVHLSEAVPAGMVWYKYDPAGGWQDYSAHASFNNDRTAVTLELKDGGYGDADGIENGIIVDPSGPGTLAPATGDGDSGCFIGAARYGKSGGRGTMVPAVLLAFAGLAWGWFAMRPRRGNRP